MILKCYPIVLWAKRIFRCTVQGKWISQDPVKSLESSLRCHWKLRLVASEMASDKSADRTSHPTRQHGRNECIRAAKSLNRREKRTRESPREIPDICAQDGGEGADCKRKAIRRGPTGWRRSKRRTLNAQCRRQRGPTCISRTRVALNLPHSAFDVRRSTFGVFLPLLATKTNRQISATLRSAA